MVHAKQYKKEKLNFILLVNLADYLHWFPQTHKTIDTWYYHKSPSTSYFASSGG